MLSELIKRLEEATGADHSIDAVIWGQPWRPDSVYSGPPWYTGSVDVALSLIPEGSSLEKLGQFMCLGKDSQALWQASVRHRTLKSPYDKSRRGDRLSSTGLMPTPALAICVAALKARKYLMTAQSDQLVA